ncbi:glycoside hydrolase family 27 protein [Alloacidobacterium sp.]|uniref:glycoside hydrolase family 27 protein n=1 Tax=Alloacidobacterium sp. TaxID=2951999 RepID=UPI002D51B50B|nr:glycoside hydrolase family 27 protein [Alloacidobacterium sp.]HYK37143.1 glycoside hydrolase family 27 protein [Alloacidobacterium sp.]
MRILATLACSIVLAAAPAFSQQLAATPPMGWNSWNHFAGHVTDEDVRSAADTLVNTGMRDAGYIYVNVDDTWQGQRDAQGVLHPNDRFPDMKALADYVHTKGLKFGIYSSPGAKTCGGYAGSLDHEAEDAKMYAAWGVDFLKYDLCSFQSNMNKAKADHPNDPNAARDLMIAAYKKMGDALKATGRPIVYSLCQYGVDQPWKWGPSVGAQMWRTTDDIDDSYGRMVTIGFSQAGLSKYAGPGHWNDPDMLEVGNGKMTEDEYKTHMSLWVLLAAPLLAGNDLSKMTDTDKSILMNKDAIAIDQDLLGKQGDRLYQSGDLDVWTKPLSGGRVAVGLFNRSWDNRDVSVNLADIGFKNGANLRDVWKQQDLGHRKGVFTDTIPKHGVTLLIVSK